MAYRRISPGPPPDEPYYYQKPALSGDNGVVAGAGSGSGSGSWHPISQDALVEPRVSSITVDVVSLQDWEKHWIEAHEGHYHPSMDLDPAQTRIGPLPDTDPDDPTGGWHYVTGLYADENGEYTGHLLRCCGMDRPLNSDERFKFVVEAKGERGFLTVYDYVDQVHRCLKGWREEILEATALERECRGHEPFSGEERLMVGAYGKWVEIMDEEEWAYVHVQRVPGVQNLPPTTIVG